MSGELLNVWDMIWSEVFVKLSKHKSAPAELFSELYEALVPKPVPPIEPEPPTAFGPNGELVDAEEIAVAEEYKVAFAAFSEARLHYEQAITGSANTRQWLQEELPAHITSERKAIAALETIFDRLRDIGGDDLANRYFNLVETFITKFSLRYDLRRPFSLHPTLPGIFASLVGGLKQASLSDAHLDAALREFEEALRDITTDQSASRIKTCIAKQTNFLEAIGQRAPNVNGNTLGSICNQVGTWPHDKLREAAVNIYKFASDYPGIRHGGSPASQLREVEMRDLIAVCVALFGVSPYLTDQLNSDDIYMPREVT